MPWLKNGVSKQSLIWRQSLSRQSKKGKRNEKMEKLQFSFVFQSNKRGPEVLLFQWGFSITMERILMGDDWWSLYFLNIHCTPLFPPFSQVLLRKKNFYVLYRSILNSYVFMVEGSKPCHWKAYWKSTVVLMGLLSLINSKVFM